MPRTAEPELAAFRSAAAACAQTVAENARCIEAHWHEVKAPPPHEQSVRELCWRLIEAWEVMHSDLTDLEVSEFAADSMDAQVKAALIHVAIDDELHNMRAIVTALRSAADDDVQYRLGWLLVSASATNIVHAYTEMSLAMNAYADALGL